MKNKVSRKITALFVSACMVLSLTSAAFAASGGSGDSTPVSYDSRDTDTSDNYAVTINSVDTSGGTVNSANVTVTGTVSATLYAAVYNLNKALAGVVTAEVTSTRPVIFSDNLEFDADTQTLKCYVWDDMKPVSDVYTAGVDDEYYVASFIKDSGVASIDVYYTQDYTTADETDVTYAVTRLSDGTVSAAEKCQVNFLVNLKDGYEIKNVAVDGSYNAIKDSTDTGVDNLYRITKVAGNLSVTITTKSTDSSTDEPSSTGDDVIHLADNNIVALSSKGGTITNVTVDNTNNTVTITPTATGEIYTMEGTLTDGQIIVTAGGKKYQTTLVLNNVSVSCSTGSALYVTEGKTIIDTNNTDSTFTSTAAEYASDGTTAQETAAINTKRDTTIQGGGSVTATSSNGNAIHCKKDLTIGDVNVTADGGNNGIKGKQSVTITEDAGTINVTAVKDGITSDYAPEIDTATNTVTASLTDMGTDAGGAVTINGGTINVTTTGTTKTGDGIQADSLLTVNGGNITVNATGEALKANCSQLDYAGADDYSTYADTLASYNGCIAITGGTINATAGEDGIKAAKDVTISDGSVTVTEAGDDGIQAGDVASSVSGTTVTFGKIDGTVIISGDSTVVDIKKAAGDGITATYKYNQTAGDVDIVSTYDGIQAGKAYSSYEIMGTSGYDDDTNIYETNGIVDISGGTLDIYTYKGGATSPGSSTLDSLDSCKGIKARKLINISGGTIGIASEDDCIHSDHTVNIAGGNITAKSSDDGVHGEYYLNISGGKIDVTQSYEGIEAAKIYITGGETYVISSDDGANGAGDDPSTLSSEKTAYTLSTVTGYEPSSTATLKTASSSSSSGSSGGSQRPGQGGPNMGQEDTSSYGYIEVSDGLLFIQAEGDGFDSNGSGLISGGTVLVNGPTSGGNGVFDKGDSSSDTLVITGGTVIGAGTSDMAVTPSSTTGSQAYVVTTVSTQSAGKAIQVLNGSNEIISYIPSKNYAWIFVSTPSISSGTSYTVKYGGSLSGGSWGANYNQHYGIKTGATFSGSSSSSVTAVTSGGSSSGDGQQGPGGQGGGQQGPGGNH